MAAPAPIRVVVADDHPAMRSGLVRMLDSHDDIDVVAAARDGAEALHHARGHRPDVLLLDVDMPGVSGVEVARQLRDERSPVRVLAFTAHTNRQFVEGLLEAGAAGYLTKDKSPAQIVEAVRAVSLGEGRWFVVPPTRTAAFESLSDREREVLVALADGRSNPEIADVLGLSESTVRNHLTGIYAALGVQSAREAVAWAWRNRGVGGDGPESPRA